MGVGGGLLRAKLSNVHELMKNINLNDLGPLRKEESHLKPILSEVDDEQ